MEPEKTCGNCRWFMHRPTEHWPDKGLCTLTKYWPYVHRATKRKYTCDKWEEYSDGK